MSYHGSIGSDKLPIPIPTAGSGPWGIADDPTHQLVWFTEFNGNKIGKINPANTPIVPIEYTIPTSDARPLGIAAGPDGAMWFTESNGNKIGRITTAGTITEFPIPTAGSGARGITAGPDGALWFTETAANKIGRITTTGVFTEFTLPSPSSEPWGITVGSDGALWFAERSGGRIGRINLALVPPFASVTHDFNGDGKSDIFWRDTSGNIASWLMNGGRFCSPGAIGVVPTHPVDRRAARLQRRRQGRLGVARTSAGTPRSGS